MKQNQESMLKIRSISGRGGGGYGRVAVIIPVYKTENYLKNAVQSVIKQSYSNIHAVILVDDGSPDNCSAICDELADQYNTVRVIHKTNGGLSSARNAGLNYLRNNFVDTDWVLFLDSDDQLQKEAILGMVRKANDTDAEMVIPDRYIKVNEFTGKREICLHFTEAMYDENPKEFALNTLIGKGRAWRAHSLLYSYKLIERCEARFPEGHISEDISFNLQVLAAAKKISIYPYPTVYYFKRSGSITTTFQNNFEQDIWYIDQQAHAFLKSINRKDDIALSKVDDLLCRNIVVYLFSIMSKSNTMTYMEKKKKAEELINNEKARKVIRVKHKLPYFESLKSRIGIFVVYYLLRKKLDKVVFLMLSKL